MKCVLTCEGDLLCDLEIFCKIGSSNAFVNGTLFLKPIISILSTSIHADRPHSLHQFNKHTCNENTNY